MGDEALAGDVEFAPAKINLYLHLTGQRDDGYHLLDSLAVFPAIGDRLCLKPADNFSLNLRGPFASGLSAGEDNLVIRSARLLSERAGSELSGASLTLEKNLPVASGIGGGSSDAAAALRLLSRHMQVHVPSELPVLLGADVPVCLRAPHPTLMSGIGEHLTPAPRLPDHWIVLINPMIGVETRAVFSATSEKNNPPPIAIPANGFGRFEDFIDWLKAQRNDLMPAAIDLCPPISDVLSALGGAALARMSGSGATCFGLFSDERSAQAAADQVRRANRGWWVVAAPVAAL